MNSDSDSSSIYLSPSLRKLVLLQSHRGDKKTRSVISALPWWKQNNISNSNWQNNTWVSASLLFTTVSLNSTLQFCSVKTTKKHSKWKQLGEHNGLMREEADCVMKDHSRVLSGSGDDGQFGYRSYTLSSHVFVPSLQLMKVIFQAHYSLFAQDYYYL